MTVSCQEADGQQLMSGLVPGQEELDGIPVARVPIRTLSVSEFSPRVSGENIEHVEMLASAQSELPPILVHRETMRVIDGVHRVRAAKLRGEDHVDARFFSGSEADAFVLAVKTNIAHGLPLSLAERKAAAERIIASHPQWSDRMIASVTGISSGTVGQIRKRCAGESAQPMARIGHDGRVRPISGAQGRILASQLIASNPELSLRQVARVAGISPETVRDVRNRLERGDDPVPKHCGVQRNASGERPARRRADLGPTLRIARPSAGEATMVVERLRADPALRFSETGRSLLRLLHVHFIETREWKKIGENVPLHCSDIIARLARDCAQMWEEFADRVEEKVADVS
jgi:ParB/Sulfiredoxin domain